MTTHHVMAGRAHQPSGLATSSLRAVVGSCLRVESRGQSATVTLGLVGGGRRDVVLPAVPDQTLARRLTGGFRRLSWVLIDATGDQVRCQVAGIFRRPRHVKIPLAAALALADDGVSTVVRLPGTGV